MILTFDKREIACLILHMTAMRTSIKNVLKSNYGKKEGKEHLKVYDQVKELLKDEFKLIQEEGEETKVSMSFEEKQIEMLSSFVITYIDKLDAFLEEAMAKNKENEEQLELLQQIRSKLEYQEIIEHV